MHRIHHARNLLLVCAILLATLLVAIPPALAQGTVTITPSSQTLTVNPGQSQQATFTINNTSDVPRTFNLSIAGASAPYTTVISPPSITVANNGTQTFQVTVAASSSATAPSAQNVTVTANDVTTGSVTRISPQALLQLSVGGTPPTPTRTPTATVGPTATLGPVCINGGEPQNEPGNGFGDARLLLVDTPERHGICSRGDEDWFVFGGVGGKVYTVDISQMDAGLDLVIDIYNSRQELVATNDDFYARDERPAPTDIRPRVQSFLVKLEGPHYIRIRDAAGLGGNNLTYTIVIRSESYGPTPRTIPEICRDLFEEDGLPEEAKRILPNELQPNRALCPDGDADWVTFFGKAGKTYYMYTDTRRYRGTVNGDTSPGADTTMILTDRDGLTVLAQSDDIPNSLDSEIRFSPVSDGFYFVQVKNIGDLGNQFIRYDLVMKLCVPNTECGRDPNATLPAPDTTTGPTATFSPNVTPSTTVAPTVSPSPEPTEDDGVADQASALTESQMQGFADQSFAMVWSRGDLPVAQQRATRSWMWGPRGLVARDESYSESSSGTRQVQYFDKARMEVNDPQGNRSSQWFVTTGLLVVELTSGQMQVGPTTFTNRGAANIPIAGDAGDTSGPTYASIGSVTGKSPDRTGSYVAEALTRAGRVVGYDAPRRAETRLARFIPETGHNIPAVFWSFLNSAGTVYERNAYRQSTLMDWVFTLGYPISEPYWARVQVAGQPRDVLIQAFERRVLTYSPDNPAGWRVEMGNVGRHYYAWRYGEQLPE